MLRRFMTRREARVFPHRFPAKGTRSIEKRSDQCSIFRITSINNSNASPCDLQKAIRVVCCRWLSSVDSENFVINFAHHSLASCQCSRRFQWINFLLFRIFAEFSPLNRTSMNTWKFTQFYRFKSSFNLCDLFSYFCFSSTDWMMRERQSLK